MCGNKGAIMDEQTTPTVNQEANQKQNSKKSKMKVVIYTLITLLVAAGVGGVVYWWRDSVATSFQKEQASDISSQKATIADLKKKLADAKAAADSTEPCTDVAPKTATIDSIKASITSGNTSALAGYMASSVNVILAATEAYGPQTPTQAVDDISSFISTDNTSWDYNFALSAATLSGYQNGDYKQYFPAIALVGKASNNQVISFSFDCDGKIDTVFMLKD